MALKRLDSDRFKKWLGSAQNNSDSAKKIACLNSEQLGLGSLGSAHSNKPNLSEVRRGKRVLDLCAKRHDQKASCARLCAQSKKKFEVQICVRHDTAWKLLEHDGRRSGHWWRIQSEKRNCAAVFRFACNVASTCSPACRQQRMIKTRGDDFV